MSVRVGRNSRVLAVCVAAWFASLLGLRCGSDYSSGPEAPRYGVTPDSVAVEVSSSQQFTVTFESGQTEVEWYVDGLLGGMPTTGMVTRSGLYVAPAKMPAGGTVTVSARSVVDSTVQADAEVVLIGGDLTPTIEVQPGLVTRAVADSVAFGATARGCLPETISWALSPVYGNPIDIGAIREDGLYVAPVSPGEDFVLMLMAQASVCPGKTGLARIVVREPRTFWAQCESYADSSGVGISRNVTCGGGLGVTGLDTAGEWISVPVVVPVAGRYVVSLHYAAAAMDVLRLTLSAAGCGTEGSSPEVSLVLDRGSGVGG